MKISFLLKRTEVKTLKYLGQRRIIKTIIQLNPMQTKTHQLSTVGSTGLYVYEIAPLLKYHTVGTVPKSNQNIVETEVKFIPLTHVLLSWPCTDTSMKGGRV